MAKARRDSGAGKALEAWEAPPEGGDPVGCVATTFTFDPVFVEEHCLSRFLRLETDPREDGAAYLIEREEKLAALTVSVLVDRSHAQGSASPRWDVLPVTLPGGIQHAKVTVLAWHGWVRVIVGSANLSEPAYRKNLEVIGVLDVRAGGTVPVALLRETLAFLRALTTFVHGDVTVAGPKTRVLRLLAEIEAMTRGWDAQPPRRHESPSVEPVFLAPTPPYRAPIPGRLGQLVRDQGGPADQAWVLSPFFDRGGETPYRGTRAVLDALTQRGPRSLGFLVPAERLPDGRLRLRAPQSLVDPSGRRVSYEVYPVFEDAEGEHRPLHAKSLWLWNDRWHGYMIGSSNFTTAGLGLEGASPNVEANLAYVFPEEGPLVRALEGTLPEYGPKVTDLDAALWEPIDETSGEDAATAAVLPAGFQDALFTPGEGEGILDLSFGEPLPERWHIQLADTAMGTTGTAIPAEGTLYSSHEWAAGGRPTRVQLPWRMARIPTALDVHWWRTVEEPLTAEWPVNVTDPGKLPPPEDLRNLSLETLVEILGSRRPLHEAVLEAKRKALEAARMAALPPELDPHRRVNTQTFLLQRTRRVARAVEQLVERLGRPVAHQDALTWRLWGPVGPVALARAIREAARSSGEAAFLLADLALALRRVDVGRAALGLTRDHVQRELARVRAHVEQMAREPLERDPSVPAPLTAYVVAALEEARR